MALKYDPASDAATFCRHNGHYCPGCPCECHTAPAPGAPLAAPTVPATPALDWTTCRTRKADGQVCIRDDDHEGWHRATDGARWPYGCLAHHGATNGGDGPYYCTQCDAPDPQTPAAREAAQPIATVCPECGTRGQVLPDPYGLIRPERQCAACPTCTRAYRVQAHLAPEPELPAYNPEDGAPCAQCGHGQDLHYEGVGECWECSDTTPRVDCPCPRYTSREAAQRADEAAMTSTACDEDGHSDCIWRDCICPCHAGQWGRCQGCQNTVRVVSGLCDPCRNSGALAQHADEAELQAGLRATLPPMAGGSGEAAHTPGPWAFGPYGAIGYDVIGGSQSVAIVNRCAEHYNRALAKNPRRQEPGTPQPYPATPEALANARLIAAAPALLEACHEAAEYISRACGTDGTPALGVLRAAIAQATLPPMAGGSAAPRCPDCGESGAARDCEPCVLATLPPMAGGSEEDDEADHYYCPNPIRTCPCPCHTTAWTGNPNRHHCPREGTPEGDAARWLANRGLPPMAGGAPSHYDDPAWYADEAWHLQEERNAESAQEAAEAEHTHFCPTCHQARPCTGTGCAAGPRECATCSQCRGW